MAMTPGGGPSPSAPPPVLPSQDSRNGTSGRRPPPRPTARNSVVHWGLVMGGLVIIADLAVIAVSQHSDGPCARPSELLDTVDLALSYILFILTGLLVYRETGQIRLAAIAGLVASLIDVFMVTAAQSSLACPLPPTGDSAQMVTDILLSLWNIAQGPVLAAAGAMVSSIARKNARP